MEMILNHIEFTENRPRDGYSSGGELYFSVGDRCFPAEYWYDSAWQDLKIWVPWLISFGSNHTDSCALSFMDGPYTIRLNRRVDGVVFADFLRENTILSQHNVDLHRLLKSVLAACRKYDRFLFENRKTNAFQEEIKTLMKLLDT